MKVGFECKKSSFGGINTEIAGQNYIFVNDKNS